VFAATASADPPPPVELEPGLGLGAAPGSSPHGRCAHAPAASAAIPSDATATSGRAVSWNQRARGLKASRESLEVNVVDGQKNVVLGIDRRTP
jgi:hypothetical protein